MRGFGATSAQNNIPQSPHRCQPKHRLPHLHTNPHHQNSSGPPTSTSYTINLHNQPHCCVTSPASLTPASHSTHLQHTSMASSMLPSVQTSAAKPPPRPARTLVQKHQVTKLRSQAPSHPFSHPHPHKTSPPQLLPQQWRSPLPPSTQHRALGARPQAGLQLTHQFLSGVR